MESQRLIMKKVTREDAKDIYNIWIENNEYMSDPVESIEEVKEVCRKHEKEEMAFLRVVLLKETGEVIGTCCFGYTKKVDEWGFGYSIKKSQCGKGYATEVVQTIISLGKIKGIKNFISEAAIENKGSIRVMEKAGMKVSDKTSFIQPNLEKRYESYVYKLNVE